MPAIRKSVTCPHCLGDGEEPGAPVDPYEIAVCDLCGGRGTVTAAKAGRYQRNMTRENE